MFVIEIGVIEIDDWEVFNCVMLSSKFDDYSFGYVGVFMEGYEIVLIVFVYGIFGFGL